MDFTEQAASIEVISYHMLRRFDGARSKLYGALTVECYSVLVCRVWSCIQRRVGLGESSSIYDMLQLQYNIFCKYC